MKSRYNVTSLTLTTYTHAQILSHSAATITSPVTFDTFGHPLHHGLYDPRLGPLTEKSGPCATCHLGYHECPGHIGHIPLPYPVLNPMTIDGLVALLNAVCHNCLFFKMGQRERLIAYAKFAMLRKGHSPDALLYCMSEVGLSNNSRHDYSDDVKNPKINDNESNIFNGNDYGNNLKSNKNNNFYVNFNINEMHLDDLYKLIERVINNAPCQPLNPLEHHREVSAFYRTCGFYRKCQNCYTKTPPYKKDKMSIIQSGVLQDITTLMNLINDCYDNEKEILTLICAGFNSEMFFLKDVVVTPSRFRPMSFINGRQFESPMNEVLSRIIKCCNLQNDIERDTIKGDINDVKKDEIKSKSKNGKIKNSENISSDKIRVEEEKTSDETCLSGDKGVSEETGFSEETKKSDLSCDEKTTNLSGLSKSDLEGFCAIEIDKNKSSKNKRSKVIKDRNNDDKNNDDQNNDDKKIKIIDSSNNNVADLQNAICLFFDSSSSKGNERIVGVKQILEKKEGLFRKHLMGKRINHAARSVISPDPHLHTREIGIPLIFAKTLSFPEKVAPFNYDRLRQSVINGANTNNSSLSGPNSFGANFLETTMQSTSIKYDLSKLTEQRRTELANRLLANDCTVHRHMRNDDVVLVNRQPTLHKPSIMAHRVRILPGEKTIRMHYANCNSYNADFDGDEMNIHFMQDHLARAEGYLLMGTDQNYLVGTDGSPVRGLVQDHIVVMARTCLKSEFMREEEFMQYIVECTSSNKTRHRSNIETSKSALNGLKNSFNAGNSENSYIHDNRNMSKDSNKNFMQDSREKTSQIFSDHSKFGHNLSNDNNGSNMNNNNTFLFYEKSKSSRSKFHIPVPTILRPIRLHTGKQIVTAILRSMGIFIDHTSKSKLNLEDGALIIRDGILLKGIMDKNQLGPTKDGLIHKCGIKYGFSICNELLTSFGRVINKIMMRQGFGAKIDEFLLEGEGNICRGNFCREGVVEGADVCIKELYDRVEINDNPNNMQEERQVKNFYINGGYTSKKYIDTKNLPEKSISNESISASKNSIEDTINIVDKIINNGDTLNKNNFDDTKNKTDKRLFNNIISINEKNSKHTFVMKNPYYFLDQNTLSYIDACVKSEMNKLTTKILDLAISQHQLIKFPYNNFSLMVLSGAKGSMVNIGQISGMLGQQELEGKRVPIMVSGTTLPCYKSNSIEPQSGGYIFGRFLDGINPSEYFFHCMAGREGLIDTAVKTARSGYLQRCLVKGLEGCCVEYDISVRCDGDVVQFMYGEDGNIDPFFNKNNNKTDLFNTTKNGSQDNKTRSKKVNVNFSDENYEDSENNTDKNLNFFNHKYNMYDNKANYQVSPGEAVGILAAQSVGEPSTQMTLNTFHLAGVGSKNVTLGIPRLVEILMVAGKTIKTPVIRLSVNEDIGLKVVNLTKRQTLKDVITCIKITEDLNYNVEIQGKEDIKNLGIEKKMKKIIEKMMKKGKVQVEIDVKGNEELIVEENNTEHNEESSDSVSNDLNNENIEDNETYDINDIDMSNECDVNEDTIDKLSDTKFNTENDLNSDDNNGDDLISDIENKKLNTDTSLSNNYSVSFELKLSRKNILLLPMIEKTLPLVVVKEWHGIKNSTYTENTLIIEGSDLTSLINLIPHELIYKTYCNDIHAILMALGVEAARNIIVNEIRSVFDVYGIKIDVRHLMLIADYMTREGGYKPFNRYGMKHGKSLLQKMCFESCFNYLKEGLVYGDMDYINNASSELCVGKNVSVGSRSNFELKYIFE
ncbi:hypothetical protein COBT_001079 [Conglomerata obtusa]